MAVWRRKSKKRGTPRTTRRRAGAFGMLRGTRNVANLRRVARLYTRHLNPFPNSKMVRHKYVDTVTMSVAGAPGVAQLYQFRANSMYDPDYTGVGHQPMFRDEMAAQYKHYTVLRSNIIVTFPSTDSQERFILIWVDDDVNIPSDQNAVMEQHKSKYAGVRQDRRNTPFTLKASFNAAKWNKTTEKAYIADDMAKTASSGNPDNSLTKWYNIWSAPMLSSTTQNALAFKVEMQFYTLWREPVDHVGS